MSGRRPTALGTAHFASFWAVGAGEQGEAGKAAALAEVRREVEELPRWDKRSVPGGFHVKLASVLAILDELEGKRP